MERSRLAVVKRASDTSEGDSLRPICDSPQERQAWEIMQQLSPQLQLLDNSFVQRYANLYASHD